MVNHHLSLNSESVHLGPAANGAAARKPFAEVVTSDAGRVTGEATSNAMLDDPTIAELVSTYQMGVHISLQILDEVTELREDNLNAMRMEFRKGQRYWQLSVTDSMLAEINPTPGTLENTRRDNLEAMRRVIRAHEQKGSVSSVEELTIKAATDLTFGASTEWLEAASMEWYADK